MSAARRESRAEVTLRHRVEPAPGVEERDDVCGSGVEDVELGLPQDPAEVRGDDDRAVASRRPQQVERGILASWHLCVGKIYAQLSTRRAILLNHMFCRYFLLRPASCFKGIVGSSEERMRGTGT